MQTLQQDKFERIFIFTLQPNLKLSGHIIMYYVTYNNAIVIEILYVS